MDRPSRLWLAGPRIRLDTLRPGDLFLDYDGQRRTVQGHDGGGTIRVSEQDGSPVTYAGCSQVVALDG